MGCYLDSDGLKDIADRLEKLDEYDVRSATLEYEGELIDVIRDAAGSLVILAEG